MFGRSDRRARAQETGSGKSTPLYGQEPSGRVRAQGASFFSIDLVRALHNEKMELDFVRLSSYGKKASSSKHVIFSKDVEIDIAGSILLIVEDIVDSGYSVQFFAGSVCRASAAQRAPGRPLLDKGERREVDVRWTLPGLSSKKALLVATAWIMPSTTACCPAFTRLRCSLRCGAVLWLRPAYSRPPAPASAKTGEKKWK